MKFYLDNTLYDNPHGWETLNERLYYADGINGYLTEINGTILFFGGAYTYLYNQFQLGICNSVSILITDNCADGNEKKVFEGLIFLTEVTFDLINCSAEIELQDNSFLAKIDNNKSIKCYLGVTRSKNDIDISAFDNPQTNIALRANNNAADVTNATGYRISDAFKFLIAFMTDGKVEFVSDFFSTTSTDLTAAYSVVMTGSQIRLGNLYEKKVYISYEDFYNDINSLFNIAFSIELINGVPTIRIEPKSYYRQTGEINYFNNPEELSRIVEADKLYSKVKFGSAEVSTTYTYFPDVLFSGFDKEEYHLLGECNTKTILDLSLNDLINDTNIIQDVLPSGSGNANYDENNFIVVLDSSNVNRSDLTIGALTYFYNKPLTNYGVSIYWFGGIPSSIAQFIGNGDDTFWTAFSTTTQTIASGAQDVILFPDDSTPPYNDINNNYNPATGRFTAPHDGFYAFELNQIFNGYPYSTIIERYNSGGVLQEYISGGFFIPPFNYFLTNVGQGYSPPSTIFELSYVWGFQMTSGDYVQIKGCPYYGSSATLLQGTYWKCGFAVTGGGIVQNYSSNDMPLIQNNLGYNISCDKWEEIKSTPFKTFLINFADGNNQNQTIKGWLKEISRNITTGASQVTLNSKPSG
jgi:hypothetical protein